MASSKTISSRTLPVSQESRLRISETPLPYTTLYSLVLLRDWLKSLIYIPITNSLRAYGDATGSPLASVIDEWTYKSWATTTCYALTQFYTDRDLREKNSYQFYPLSATIIPFLGLLNALFFAKFFNNSATLSPIVIQILLAYRYNLRPKIPVPIAGILSGIPVILMHAFFNATGQINYLGIAELWSEDWSSFIPYRSMDLVSFLGYSGLVIAVAYFVFRARPTDARKSQDSSALTLETKQDFLALFPVFVAFFVLCTPFCRNGLSVLIQRILRNTQAYAHPMVSVAVKTLVAEFSVILLRLGALCDVSFNYAFALGMCYLIQCAQKCDKFLFPAIPATSKNRWLSWEILNYVISWIGAMVLMIPLTLSGHLVSSSVTEYIEALMISIAKFGNWVLQLAEGKTEDILYVVYFLLAFAYTAFDCLYDTMMVPLTLIENYDASEYKEDVRDGLSRTLAFCKGANLVYDLPRTVLRGGGLVFEGLRKSDKPGSFFWYYVFLSCYDYILSKIPSFYKDLEKF